MSCGASCFEFFFFIFPFLLRFEISVVLGVRNDFLDVIENEVLMKIFNSCSHLRTYKINYGDYKVRLVVSAIRQSMQSIRM